MQFINYFFASIISFSGLIIGLMLVKIAPEEQKKLKKYLILARKIIISLIFIFIIFYYFDSWFYVAALIAYFAFLFFMEYRANDMMKKSMLVYAVLGILFFLSSKNANLFIIESSLVLLYGMPTASLMYKIKEKNHHKIIFYNTIFILIANMLFFI